jgi:hypothetical protein
MVAAPELWQAATCIPAKSSTKNNQAASITRSTSTQKWHRHEAQRCALPLDKLFHGRRWSAATAVANVCQAPPACCRRLHFVSVIIKFRVLHRCCALEGRDGSAIGGLEAPQVLCCCSYNSPQSMCSMHVQQTSIEGPWKAQERGGTADDGAFNTGYPVPRCFSTLIVVCNDRRGTKAPRF